MLFRFEPDPGPEMPWVVRLVVEIPRDSSNKYEFDESLGLFRLARSLYSPIHYPGDYGFLPGTLAEDGEALDVLCLVNSPSFTGCVCDVRPVAVLDMLDGEQRDHKVLAVQNRDPRFEEMQNIHNVNEHTIREIEHFFKSYKDLEGKTMIMGGWRDAESARLIVSEARERYLAKEALLKASY
ncbi:MAG TPA: inorganic diphosphatase [Bryobacteraceae bacterium]|nr:inorganic diphosphatase [Bryobacteraceae bacterium]